MNASTKTCGSRERLVRSAVLVAVTLLLSLSAAVPARADHGKSGMAQLTGVVASLPSGGMVGDWVVDTTTVHVTGDTSIHGTPAVGSTVEVKGTLESDGSITAAMINVEDSGGTPEPQETEFTGVIASLPSGGLVGDWVVDTTTVHVTDATTIDQTHGAVAVGVTVEVDGVVESDGSVTANKIKVEETAGGGTEDTEFTGVVQSLPSGGLVGDWTVDTTIVHVSASTLIDQHDGAVAVGVTVKVEGTAESDGSVDAAKIEVVGDSSGGGDNNKPPQSMTFSVLHLVPTALAPEGAEGVVVTRMFTFTDGTSDQDLKVAVEGLAPGAVYEVIIDTIDAGPIMTNDEGEGSLFLSTRSVSGAQPLPATLQPVTGLVHIDVVDSSTNVILAGDFANAKTHDQEHPSPAVVLVAPLTGGGGSTVGMAMARDTGNKQSLDVRVWNLTANTPYIIVVDGITLGPITTDGHGELEADFSNPADGGDLLLPDTLLPVSGLLHLEVQATDSTVVASGDFVAVNTASVTNNANTNTPRRRLGGH